MWLGQVAFLPAAQEQAAAERLERAGYGALWFGEAPGNREALSHAGLLLAATERLTVAPGSRTSGRATRSPPATAPTT